MPKTTECNECFPYAISCRGEEGKIKVFVGGAEVATIKGEIPNCIVFRKEKGANTFIGAMLTRAEKQTATPVESQIDELMFNSLRITSSPQGL